ncbi:MAG: beta-lactamase family protein [Acidobacteria bacterium]|nr:beta-lactamase family protein [Acidobacteriota bacterium]
MRAYSGEVPGASVLVLRDGDPVLRESWGYANLEKRDAAHSGTNYRLASVTKQFTAAAILMLARDGVLDLADGIRVWLPSLPPSVEPVTIHHLLTHTSGLVDYEDLIPANTTRQLRDVDVLKLLESVEKTYFPPGSAYRYSNSGYALLALVVEEVSGKPFATFLRERIFQPLEMNGSVAFERGISTVSDRAYGYSRDGEVWKLDDQSLTSAVLGDGGIYSSIDDLAKWDAALTTGSLLGATFQQLAFTPATATDRSGVSYGFGWRLENRTQWHTGETRGFRTAIFRDPGRRLTVIVLTNRNEGEPIELARRIAAVYDGGQSDVSE